MTTFLVDARETVAPPRDDKDGLLPPLLVALTAVTGLVDAFSYLVLGHVFVANMTGNVIAAMLAGALAGAVLVLHAHIVYPLAIALVLLVAAALVALARARPPSVVS